jgi:uncharacterized peroxidase-related enzyme
MKDDALLDAIEADFERADITDKRLSMLRYSLKLTASPWSMEQGDIEAMRAAGHSDTDILHITEVVGYYAYVNRIADGLNVPLEDWIDYSAE